MDAPYSPLEFSLLNDWQRNFPLCAHPFAEIGTRVGVPRGFPSVTGDDVASGQTAVIATLQRLQRRGAISRLGAVFSPRRAGAGTLAALAAPAERLEEIAAMISARPEVNHNYQREHQWNLWFVVTACNRQTLAATLASIETQTGCKVLSMPLKHEYHIDLGFNLNTVASGSPRPHRMAHAGTDRSVAEVERTPEALRLLSALEDGLALVARPYEELGRRCGLSEAQVISYLTDWQTEGLIKRFGVVVRHHEMGYRSNAMVVFDIPDDEVDAVGECLAKESAVTLCYRRERSLPQWNNNLYCMVHGKSRDEVAPVIDRLAALAGVTPSVLFSVRRFKQCGARYFAGMAT